MANPVKLGDVFETKYGKVTVIKYEGFRQVTVKYDDGYVTTASLHNLRKGNVKNKNIPSVCGLGFIGQGEHKPYTDGKPAYEYVTWKKIMLKCSNKSGKKFTVDERWLNYQNYVVDVRGMFGFGNPGWKMFKMSFCDPDGLYYSKETCAFLPSNLGQSMQRLSDCMVCDYSGYSKVSRFPKTVKQDTAITASAAFITRVNDKHIGVFNTAEEARCAFIKNKVKATLATIEKHKNVITPDTYAELRYRVKIFEGENLAKYKN